MSEKEYVFVGTAQLKTRDYIKSLEKENKRLQERIDKAIEYIKKNSYGWETKYFQDEAKANELLEILGDKE